MSRRWKKKSKAPKFTMSETANPIFYSVEPPPPAEPPQRSQILAELYGIFKGKRVPVKDKLSAARMILGELDPDENNRTGSTSRADFLIRSLLAKE